MELKKGDKVIIDYRYTSQFEEGLFVSLKAGTCIISVQNHGLDKNVSVSENDVVPFEIFKCVKLCRNCKYSGESKCYRYPESIPIRYYKHWCGEFINKEKGETK